MKDIYCRVIKALQFLKDLPCNPSKYTQIVELPEEFGKSIDEIIKEFKEEVDNDRQDRQE